MRYHEDHVKMAREQGLALFKLEIDRKFTVREGKRFVGGKQEICGAATPDDLLKLRALYMALNGVSATAPRSAPQAS